MRLTIRRSCNFQSAQHLREAHRCPEFPESFQTSTCIIVHFLRCAKVGAEIGDQEIMAKKMGGKTKIVGDCKTEEQRLEALQNWCGMTFTEEEKAGIRGWRTESRGEGSEDRSGKVGQAFRSCASRSSIEFYLIEPRILF